MIRTISIFSNQKGLKAHLSTENTGRCWMWLLKSSSECLQPVSPGLGTRPGCALDSSFVLGAFWEAAGDALKTQVLVIHLGEINSTPASWLHSYSTPMPWHLASDPADSRSINLCLFKRKFTNFESYSNNTLHNLMPSLLL